MFRMIILKIRYFKQFFVNFAMEDVSIMVLVKIIIISFFIHVNAPRLGRSRLERWPLKRKVVTLVIRL